MFNRSNLRRLPFGLALGAVAPIFLFFPLALLWLEMVVKVACLGTLFDRGLAYTSLFTLPLGLILALLPALFHGKVRHYLSIALLALVTLWYAIQTVYFTFFKTFFAVDSLNMATDVLQFWRDILLAIVDSALPLLFLLLPLVVLIVLGKRFMPTEQGDLRALGALALVAVVLQTTAVTVVVHSNQGVLSPRTLYEDSFIPELSVSTFGVATTLRLDINALWGTEEESIPDDDSSPSVTPTVTDDEDDVAPTPTPEVVYEPNIMDIDFETLIANETDATLLDMHEYFSQRTPTMQNEYTGMFAGKNLIFMTVEGFSPYAVDEVLTPTLYRLTQEGIVCTDFYTPLWWKSTIDGEYVACTGLVPSSSIFSFATSGSNSMPFTMGNQFLQLDYVTYAYHNHTYNYYSRDISHPNMGYIYKGLGSGLDVTPLWPESDLEMMELSIADYIDNPPFHAYYMTVSGHLNYSFIGNSMSAKHKAEAMAAYPDNSEEFQAYKACHMEFDLALEYLMEALEEAGQLDNTVICFSADHYPYGMDRDALDELAGHELEDNFEVYHSTFVLWSSDIETPIVIDKPVDSSDINATLSNLFGLEYDSRLLVGQDILSDAPSLVMFSNRSFITDLGRYNSLTDEFTPNEGVEVPDGYVLDTFYQVQDLFYYSVKILEEDYYGKIGLTVDNE